MIMNRSVVVMINKRADDVFFMRDVMAEHKKS